MSGWKKQLSLASALIALTFTAAAGCATAPVADADPYDDEAYGFGDWDDDADGFVDEDEFASGIDDDGVFTDWDRNQDTMLDEDEISTGLFAEWDTDRSGALDEEEYASGVGTWYDGRYGSFSAMDADNDAMIAEDEFGAYDDAGLFGDWDEDRSGFVEDDEFSTGLFGTWDNDESGVLEDDEFLL